MTSRLVLALALTAVLTPAPVMGSAADGAASDSADSTHSPDSTSAPLPRSAPADDNHPPARLAPRSRPRSMTPT